MVKGRSGSGHRFSWVMFGELERGGRVRAAGLKRLGNVGASDTPWRLERAEAARSVSPGRNHGHGPDDASCLSLF